MKRNYSEPLRQIISGIKKYSTTDLKTFLEQKNKVEHGKRGIVVNLEGNYALSIEIIKESKDVVYETLFSKIEIIHTFGEIKTTLEQYPFFNKGINLILHPYLIESEKIKLQEQYRVSILNPQIHLMKDFDNLDIIQLIDLDIAPKTKKRKKEDLLYKINEFQIE